MLNRSSVITAIVAATLCAAGSVSAQAWHYPTLQAPEISTRDFSVQVGGGGDYGTDVVGRWREGITPDAMFNIDVGFSTPGSSTLFDAGAGVGYKFLSSTQELPIDLIGTAGIYGAFGDGSELRIPFGVVAGHKFPISGTSNPLAVTPFVSPRLTIDSCISDCNGEGTHLKVNFDIGASLDITREFGIQAALTVGGIGDAPSRSGFAIGATYRPTMVARH